MKKYTFIILCAVASLTSCTTFKQNTRTSKTTDVRSTGIVQTPVLADLEVKEAKVSGTATTTSQDPSVENAKSLAVADALTKSNADVLVEPTYETTTERGRTTVVVKGYPAIYRNFRNGTLMEQDNGLGTITGNPVNTQENKPMETKTTGQKIWGWLGLGVAVVTLALI